jgi:hypothetical protein
VAKYGDIEEFVNTNPFERIIPYFKNGINELNDGGFLFTNSAIVPSFDNQWRCDAGTYGVELFADPLGGSIIAMPDTIDGLIVYEPILSINGVAHLIYVEIKIFKQIELMNNSITPFATYSLGEALKLIIEWSQASQEPFNNSEPIALKAFEFTQKIGIPEILVRNQTDMQVAEYLKGNPNARRRPTDVVETNQELLDFVKRKMAHMSLSSLLSCYPEYDNLDAEIQFDIESADKQFVDYLGGMQIQGSFTLDNWEDALEFLPEHLVHASGLFVLRWGCLKRQKDLALALANQ